MNVIRAICLRCIVATAITVAIMTVVTSFWAKSAGGQELRPTYASLAAWRSYYQNLEAPNLVRDRARVPNGRFDNARDAISHCIEQAIMDRPPNGMSSVVVAQGARFEFPMAAEIAYMRCVDREGFSPRNRR